MVEGSTKISVSVRFRVEIVNVTAEIPTFQPASFTRDNISDSVDTDPVGQIRH